MAEKLNRRSFLGKGALGVGALALGATGLTEAAAPAATGDLFSQINHAKNPAKMTPLEKKHVPEITVPQKVKAGEPFEVRVKVNHVMQKGHFIQWLEVYNGDLFLARVDLTAVTTRPEATLTLTLEKSAELKFYEHCNLHGTWENSVRVHVA